VSGGEQLTYGIFRKIVLLEKGKRNKREGRRKNEINNNKTEIIKFIDNK
jgi:hypothetical protein